MQLRECHSFCNSVLLAADVLSCLCCPLHNECTGSLHTRPRTRCAFRSCWWCKRRRARPPSASRSGRAGTATRLPTRTQSTQTTSKSSACFHSNSVLLLVCLVVFQGAPGSAFQGRAESLIGRGAGTRAHATTHATGQHPSGRQSVPFPSVVSRLSLSCKALLARPALLLPAGAPLPPQPPLPLLPLTGWRSMAALAACSSP